MKDNKASDKKKFPVWIVPVAAIALIAILLLILILGILGIKAIKNNNGGEVGGENNKPSPIVTPFAKYDGPEITEDEVKELLDESTLHYYNEVEYRSKNLLISHGKVYKDYSAVVCAYFRKNKEKGANEIFNYVDDDGNLNNFDIYFHDDGSSYTWDELLNCVNYEIFEETESFDINKSYNDILNKWSHISSGYWEGFIKSDIESITKIVYPANEGRTQKFDDYNCDCEVYFTTINSDDNDDEIYNKNFVAYLMHTDDGWKILDIDYAD